MNPTMRACAWNGCSKPVRTPFTIAGLPNVQYCSKPCLEAGFAAFIKGRREEIRAAREQRTNSAPELAEEVVPPEPDDLPDSKGSTVAEVIAKEFGSAAVLRHLCDRDQCRKPVTLGWKGRDGEYCSNKCFKLAEKEGEKTMTDDTQILDDEDIETEDDDTQDDDSPVTAGKDKKKKSKAAPAPLKKGKASAKAVAVAKKVVPKAAAPKAAARNGNSNGDRRITLTKKASELRGKRQVVYSLIKSGMTVSQLQDAAVKKLQDDSFRTRALVVLKVCQAEGLCTVK